MTILQKIGGTVDKYRTVLSDILKVNIEVIDENFKVVSTTEEGNINKKNDAHIYRSVLMQGEKKLITNPREDEICQTCPRRDTCIDTFELHTPIKLDGKNIGVICFSCADEKQKEHILNDFNSVIEFIDHISELISLKARESQENEKTMSFIDVMNNVIDKVEQGILLLGEGGQVKEANSTAMKILKLEKAALESGGLYADIKSGINQNEYTLILNGKTFSLIGEYHHLGVFNSEYSSVFFFERASDFNRKAAGITNTRENVRLDNILGESPEMISLKANVRKIASSSSTILITGPSGTGKELFARALHQESNRKDQPFVAINCAAIPDTLLESELFGYVKGAFTGADPKGKIGKIELANNGVLFLDEIGDMPLYLQAKVLRALEQQEVVRLGSSTPVYVDVRFIAATNKDLKKMISEKKFREDLYYRLNVIPLNIPALKERKKDIPILTDYFIKKYAGLFQKEINGIEDEALERLNSYSWPGNVRELENTVEYMINMAGDGECLNVGLLPMDIFTGIQKMEDGTERLDHMERAAIERALLKYGTGYSEKKRVADALGISVATLYRKINKYGLDD